MTCTAIESSGVTVVAEVFSQHPDPHSDRPLLGVIPRTCRLLGNTSGEALGLAGAM